MAIPDPTQLAAVRRNTVSDVPDVKKNGNGASASDFLNIFVTERGLILPQWGTRARTRASYDLYHNALNWMGRSVIADGVHRLASKQWTIKGKRNVEKFQNVLLYADMGRGWRSFVEKVIAPFYYQDVGGWAEIVAPGNPNRPPTGAVVGVKSLDPLRVTPTGDPEFPILYTNTAGELHRIHRTRCHQFVDMADPNESRPGYGMSSQSRAAVIVMQQIYAAAYINGLLDDEPSPGINIFSNIVKPAWDKAVNEWHDYQNRDNRPPTGRAVNVFSTNPEFKAHIESVQFSQAPENFSYKEYTELWANAWALCIGTDPNNLWRRSSGALGSGSESQVADDKEDSRIDGVLQTAVERFINTAVLPDYLTFEFDDNNPRRSEQKAKTAQAWSSFANALKDTATANERRQLLAAQVPEFFDVVTDPKGEVIALAEDPVSDEQQNVKPGEAPKAEAAPPRRVDDGVQTAGSQNAETGEKAIADTRQRFEREFTALLTSGQEKAVSRRAFEAQLRTLIARYGDLALRDGLAEGGVEQPDEDEAAAYAKQLVQQSKYVKAFAANLYAQPDLERAGRAAMWWNKSIEPFHQIGVAAIAKNGNFKWIYGDTEHCADCLRLNGQIHRMRDYVRRGWLPQADKLACKGFRCGCRLERTSEKAVGKF